MNISAVFRFRSQTLRVEMLYLWDGFENAIEFL